MPPCSSGPCRSRRSRRPSASRPSSWLPSPRWRRGQRVQGSECGDQQDASHRWGSWSPRLNSPKPLRRRGRGRASRMPSASSRSVSGIASIGGCALFHSPEFPLRVVSRGLPKRLQERTQLEPTRSEPAIVAANDLVRVFGEATPPCALSTGSRSTSPRACSPRSWAPRVRASPRSCTPWRASTDPPPAVTVDGVELGDLDDAELTGCAATRSASSFNSSTCCRC